jgi:branched-chain amino acid transport system substrate-binding protein
MKASDPLFGSAADYNKQMKAAHPEYKVVPYQTAEASAAVYVWKNAFERAGSLDQEKVREALTKTDMQTFCGRISFAADGSNPGKTMTMRQIQGGKYKVVWPREIAASDVVYPRDAHY